MTFKVDGISYGVGVVSLQRKASVLDGENASRTLSGDMKRDIIGTYYNYELVLSTKDLDVAAYDRLYEILTAPEDSHTVVMPYGQGTQEFLAYVTNASDRLVFIRDGLSLWKGLTVNFIAMGPKRYPI